MHHVIYRKLDFFLVRESCHWDMRHESATSADSFGPEPKLHRGRTDQRWRLAHRGRVRRLKRRAAGPIQSPIGNFLRGTAPCHWDQNPGYSGQPNPSRKSRNGVSAYRTLCRRGLQKDPQPHRHLPSRLDGRTYRVKTYESAELHGSMASLRHAQEGTDKYPPPCTLFTNLRRQ